MRINAGMEVAVKKIVLATLNDYVLKREFEDLRQRLTDLEKDVGRHAEENVQLRQIIENYQTGLEETSEEKKKEKFYQTWLESVLQGGHRKLPIGITDISNDRFDAEIKTYKRWNQAIGQLNLYNSYTKAPLRILALFDAPDDWTAPKALIEACDRFSIRLVLLSDEKDIRGIETKEWLGSDWKRADRDILKLFAEEVTGRRPDLIELCSFFIRRYIEKSDDTAAHFTVKQARKLWPRFISELIADGLLGKSSAVPKELELRNELITSLNAVYNSEKRYTPTAKYYGGFSGYVLRDRAQASS